MQEGGVKKKIIRCAKKQMLPTPRFELGTFRLQGDRPHSKRGRPALFATKTQTSKKKIFSSSPPFPTSSNGPKLDPQARAAQPLCGRPDGRPEAQASLRAQWKVPQVRTDFEPQASRICPTVTRQVTGPKQSIALAAGRGTFKLMTGRGVKKNIRFAKNIIAYSQIRTGDLSLTRRPTA